MCANISVDIHIFCAYECSDIESKCIIVDLTKGENFGWF